MLLRAISQREHSDQSLTYQKQLYHAAEHSCGNVSDATGPHLSPESPLESHGPCRALGNLAEAAGGSRQLVSVGENTPSSIPSS